MPQWVTPVLYVLAAIGTVCLFGALLLGGLLVKSHLRADEGEDYERHFPANP